jgi:hypothetical protein
VDWLQRRPWASPTRERTVPRARLSWRNAGPSIKAADYGDAKMSRVTRSSMRGQASRTGQTHSSAPLTEDRLGSTRFFWRRSGRDEPPTMRQIAPQFSQ